MSNLPVTQIEGRSGVSALCFLSKLCSFLIISLSVAALSLGVVACTDSGAGGNGDDDYDGSVGDSDSSTDEPDVGVTGDSGPDDGDGGTGSDGGQPAKRFLELQLSSNVVERERDDGELEVACHVYDLDESGAPLEDPQNVEITIDGLPYEVSGGNGDTYTFSERGSATVNCSKTDWGVSVESEIVVVGKWIDPVYVITAEQMFATLTAVRRLIDSDGREDSEAVEAFESLNAAVTELEARPPSSEVDVIRDFPGEIPTREEIESVFPPSDDDDAYASALSAVKTLLQESRGEIEGLNPEEVTQAQIDSMEADSQALLNHIETLGSLSPAPGIVMEKRQEIAELLLDEAAGVNLALSRYVSDIVTVEDGVLFPKFGFISLSMGMFNQSNIRIKLINKVYGKHLKALDAAFNTLAIGGLVDKIWPPDEGGPEITMIQGSASMSYICGDYPTTIYGYRFNEVPSKNSFIIIGNNLTSTVESLWNLINADEDETIWDLYEKLQDFIDEVEGLGGNIQYGLEFHPDALGPGEDGVFIGPFPDLNNTSLPQPVHIIPMNKDVGRGPSYQSNLLGNCN